MGSLFIFAVIILTQLIIMPIMYCFNKKYEGCEGCMGRWKMGGVYDSLVPATVIVAFEMFLMEAYFELVLCCALSSKMVDIRPIW